MWHDSSLDNSDCTPLVLARLEEFAVEVPYRKACQFMQTWGVQISKSKVALLSQTLEKNLQELGEPRLEALASQTLIRKDKSAVTQAQRQVTWMLLDHKTHLLVPKTHLTGGNAIGHGRSKWMGL